MHSGSPQDSVVVAVPVYGTRILPRFGLAQVFWLVQRLADGSTRDLGHLEWSPAVAVHLPGWLKQQRVDGVICGGIHGRFRVALEGHGIWVIGGQRGEARAVFTGWLRGEIDVSADPMCSQGAPGCGVRRQRCRNRGASS